ncbi:hypothetical protein LSCM1_01578 [Leishmania martiniquensis]|uniref:Uncharacterized protein n=1 Tax=Leishmania martiniquensis TaxID=1580590 RepID=A0A836KEY5_9TRYP|nr:hypothetical protein LSCM1_01578 [Leishmania martiniquensis]
MVVRRMSWCRRIRHLCSHSVPRSNSWRPWIGCGAFTDARWWSCSLRATRLG